MENQIKALQTLDKTIEKYEKLKSAKERMMNAVCLDFKGLFKNEINLINLMLNDLELLKSNMEV